MQRLAFLALFLLSCGPAKTTAAPPGPHGPGTTGNPCSDGDPVPDLSKNKPAEIVEVSLAEVGLDAAALDPDVDPCQDFFQYACGGWLETHEIPADKARYARFTEVIERNREALRAIVESARKGKTDDPIQKKVGAYYGACMDEKGVEAQGTKALQPLMKHIRKVKNTETLVDAIVALHRHGIYAVFSRDTTPDFADSTVNVLFVDSGGLGLPDRDYYLKDDEEFQEHRAFYKKHVARMFGLLGRNKAAARRAAADVMRVEKALAEVTKTRVERRDIPKLYNPTDLDGLGEMGGGFPWKAYFEGIGKAKPGKVVVTTPKYVKALGPLVKEIKPKQWQNYLTWQLLHATADALPKRFEDEAFALEKQLSDRQEQEPRWKRCIDATTGAMGEYLGKLFVAEKFGGDSKEAAETMTREIAAAFAAELDANEWMSEKTVKAARAKLDMMSSLIGHPEEWKSYDFTVAPKSYAKNALAAAAFETKRQLDKAGEEVDRREWHMPPHVVNAYYNPLANQMAFPAGILQPPFFGADRSIAANLGGMGMIVGHELTHGFDDSGARFDGNGNMVNWWQEEDGEKFAEKGQCLVDQYSKYEPVPGLNLNGKLTLGENIADLGGVKLAFRAYRNLRSDAEQRYVADGLTEDQIFFLGTGQAWCSKMREKEVRRRVTIDPHSPARYRVNGVVANLPEFAEAFSCQQGTPMRPAKTCEVW